MRRRKFITLVGGAAAWPVAARAQQPERMRRIGVLLPVDVGDADYQARMTLFRQELQQLGWTESRNIRIDIRWAGGDVSQIRKYAAELATLAPDVVFASGSGAAGPMLQATRTIPIVFAALPDPVASGLVKSLARPGGNATGFIAFEYSTSAKWMELLKEIAPGVKRVAVLREAGTPIGSHQFAAIQSAAPSLGIEPTPINVSDADEITRSVTAFALAGNGGLVVTQSAGAFNHRDLILALAMRHRMPSVHSARVWVVEGALLAYGPDRVDQIRQAAGYVDRILKGEKPADLPVQAPTKYELAINLKTAKALGITVPPTMLGRADEVIE